MAVTKAQICNLALAHIHQTDVTISNLDTDTGNTAIQCRIHYDVCRQFVQTAHQWNYCTKRETLADIGSPPAEWGFRYDMPSDALLFQEIQRATRSDPAIVFKIEDDGTGGGSCILTDQAAAVGIYTFDVENTARFSPGFVTTFSWYLASELAPAIAGDYDLQEVCLTVYRNHLALAQAVDSNEGQADPDLDSPWERARIFGADNV